MSRRNRGRVKSITPRAVAQQGGKVTDQTAAVSTMTSQAAQVPPMARLMPSPASWDVAPFGPGRPLQPQPINAPRADSGRPEPRLYEYPVSWNLNTAAQRLVPWPVLRAAADGVSMFRRCIQVRKDHMTGLDWDIVIGQDALDAAQRKADRAERAAKPKAGSVPKPPADQVTTSPTPPPTAKPTPAPSPSLVPGAPGTLPAPEPTQGQTTPADESAEAAPTGRAAVEDEMRDRLAAPIDAAKKFMRAPDRGQGLSFEAWLGQLLEEVFVLDALVIYPRYTNGGDLWSLEILDGTTIKPLLDDRGGRPLPPYPAYQQVLYGFPRGDFQATVSETEGPNGEALGTIEDGYPSDQLIYAKRVNRVWSPYGMSPVEQALDDGSLYVKRHLWMLSEYTDGTSISGLFTTEENTNWSPEQLAEYETWFNRVAQGSAAERHSARFLPPFVKPIDNGKSIGSDALAEKYRPDYDMHLLKLMVSHFDTTLPELGFTDAGGGGLGATGYHEGQAAVQSRKRLPIIKFVEGLLTGIMHDHFGMPDELEFKFLGLDDEDEPGAAELDMKRQAAGVTTLNEERDKLGLARYEFAEADMPYVSTGRGLVFIEGASEVAQPVPAGFLEAPPMPPKPGQGAAGAPASSPPALPTAPTQPAAPAQATAKAAEVAAYRRWLSKGAAGGRRPFRWEHHDDVEVANLVKAGGEQRPKAPWPGWSRDLAVMDAYVPRIVRASTGAIGAATLAARWSEHGGTPDAARAWVGEELNHGARLAAALTPVLHGLWTEGWLIGDKSADFMLRQLGPRPTAEKALTKSAGDVEEFNHETDWGSWKPGDARAAKAILDGSGRYPGLRQLIERGDITISSIASHRLDELAKILSQAAGEGWSNGRTAAALRGVLSDPAWARMVAITEVSRASSASSLSRYAANGVDAKSWMTAMDQRVCPECEEDGAQGDIPAADYFQDGNDAPPGHPTCRCAIAPGWLPVSDIAGASGGGPGLGDLAGIGGLSEEEAGLGVADALGEDAGVERDFEAEDAAEEERLQAEAEQAAESMTAEDVIELAKNIANYPVKYGARERELMAWGRKHYDGVFGDLSTKIEAVTPTDGYISFTGNIENSAGDSVGYFERTVGVDENGALYAYHDLLNLDREVQGQGFSSKFNSFLKDWYRVEGIGRIELLANIDVGGYAWARSGFNFADDVQMKSVIKRMVSMMEKVLGPSYESDTNPELQELVKRIRAIESSGRATAWEISELGRSSSIRNGDSWFGRSVLLGSGWGGVLWL